METPIYNFVNKYISENACRFHMPGHKGVSGLLGVEKGDITEIDGADELYLANGIIEESEKNAGKLFNAHTFYSTEGSSLAIRAALALLVMWAREQSDIPPVILAGRNAHKTLIDASITLDFDIDWIMPSRDDSYESCTIDAAYLSQVLEAYKTDNRPLPVALYITSPDYLGHISDIKALAQICHSYGIYLFADNAHGAYLKFLHPSLHPMDLGADMCSDSAHKTLPVLTGGAYLHISRDTNPFFMRNAQKAMSLFGSTSPSYLILQSLDIANLLMEKYEEIISTSTARTTRIKEHLRNAGYWLIGNEPQKITIRLATGCGKEIAKELYKSKIIPEYYDNRHIVFMITPNNSEEELNILRDFFEQEKIRLLAECKPIQCVGRTTNTFDRLPLPQKAMSAREAFFRPSEKVLIRDSIGKILSDTLLSCPPAIPLFMSGEVIDERIITHKEWTAYDTINVIADEQIGDINEQKQNLFNYY